MDSIKNSPPSGTDAIEKRLADIQSKLYLIEKNRKTSSIISLIGVLAIIITLAVFIISLYSFVKKYDTETLVTELHNRSTTLVSSPEATQLIEVMKGSLLPAYEASLSMHIQKTIPLVKKDIETMKVDLAAYLENSVKPRLEENIVNQMSNTEASALLSTITSEESQAKIQHVVAITKGNLVNELPDFIETRLDPVIIQLDILNESFNKIYLDMVKSGEFAGVTPAMTGEIENRLIENLLEIIIYELNPQKANMKAKQ